MHSVRGPIARILVNHFRLLQCINTKTSGRHPGWSRVQSNQRTPLTTTAVPRQIADIHRTFLFLSNLDETFPPDTSDCLHWRFEHPISDHFILLLGGYQISHNGAGRGESRVGSCRLQMLSEWFKGRSKVGSGERCRSPSQYGAGSSVSLFIYLFL